jgi:ATP-dependent Zn protease
MATTPERSDEELRATAYHEAGHAVIAIALGLTIKKVNIIKGQDYNGYV